MVSRRIAEPVGCRSPAGSQDSNRLLSTSAFRMFRSPVRAGSACTGATASPPDASRRGRRERAGRKTPRQANRMPARRGQTRKSSSPGCSAESRCRSARSRGSRRSRHLAHSGHRARAQLPAGPGLRSRPGRQQTRWPAGQPVTAGGSLGDYGQRRGRKGTNGKNGGKKTRERVRNGEKDRKGGQREGTD